MNTYAARIVFRHSQHLSFRPTSFDENEYIECLDVAGLPEKHFEFLVFIRSALLPVRVGTDLCVQPYYPNRFARQFGLDQGIPTNKLKFNFAQRYDRIEEVAKAQHLFLRRDTNALFCIPRASYTGVCTYWYCRWWVRNSAPYLGISVRKIHHTLTKRQYNQPEPVFVIKNIRTPTRGIKRAIMLTEVAGTVPKTLHDNCGITYSGERIKFRNHQELSSDDINPKRARYERSRGSNGDASYAGVPYKDLPVDESSGTGVNQGEALGNLEGSDMKRLDTGLDDERVDYDGSDDFVMADPSITLPLEPCKATFSLERFLPLISTELGPNIDHLTRNFVTGLMQEIINQISACSSPEILLESRAKVMKSIQMIRGVITETDSGMDEVNWFAKTVTQTFELSETIACDDIVLRQGTKFDVTHINDLATRHTECLRVKESLSLELMNVPKQSDDLKAKEAQILEEESRIRAMRTQLEIEQSAFKDKVKQLESSLGEQDAVDQELQKLMLEAGNKEFQAIEARKEEFQKLLNSLQLFCGKH